MLMLLLTAIRQPLRKCRWHLGQVTVGCSFWIGKDSANALKIGTQTSICNGRLRPAFLLQEVCRIFASIVLLGLGSVRPGQTAEQALDPAKLPPAAQRSVDFTREIRPLLESKCFGCHGPEKQKSDLRLDIRSSAMKGGQHGEAIVPGQSARSPLIQFVAGLVEDMRMPPPGSKVTALTPEQVGLLRAWIDQGAAWPEEAEGRSIPAKADHWAFQEVSRPEVPAGLASHWPRQEVDRFILQDLQRNGLSPSPEADRRTLIRRVAFDVTGLPPTPEEVSDFVADTRTDAYERLVERLLSSPRYGERWARHWLDTIHYGETHGYDKDKTRPNAWPYRDYVIRALNSDKPYSRFVQEQLAGDVLFPDDPDGVVALGFLAAGPWDFVGHVELPESKTDGLIARYNDRDDMVMTAMSTLQSLTVHCARCHDHKFDPIAQEDYYSLQAVFAGVDRADRWFDADPGTFRQRKALLGEKKALESRLAELNAAMTRRSPSVFKLIDAKRDDLRKQLAALPKPGSEDSPSNGYHSEIGSQPDLVKWVQIDLGKAMPIDEIRLLPARPTDFADTPGFGFPVRFRVEIAQEADAAARQVLRDETKADFPNPGDQAVVVAAQGKSARFVRITATRLWPRTGDYVFALAEIEVTSGGRSVAGGVNVEALDSIESGRWAKKYLVDGYDSRKRSAAAEELLAVASRQRATLQADLDQLQRERRALIEHLVDESTRQAAAEVEASLARVNSALAALAAPSQVFAASHEFAAAGNFRPAVQPRPVHLLRRGEVKQPIRLAEPGALSCLPGLQGRFHLSDAENEGARRAALARWITQPANLLTRRSIVNRVWQYHFGRGIVETPNDFGHMGALPTHPELLDWLAFWFRDQGESLKSLHRLILTSATYRQASAHRPDCARIDADNRFLWRMNRARLDAESLRDSILQVSGKLDLAMGGPSVQQFFFKDDHSPVYDYARFDIDSAAALRRSVYRFVVRSVPDPFMETMDCPDPSLLTPKRNTTVTALQALALLNDPFVLRQAETFAARLAQTDPAPAAQVTAAYERAISRAPTDRELSRLTEYARAHGTTNLCRLVFNTSEFMFVD